MGENGRDHSALTRAMTSPRAAKRTFENDREFKSQVARRLLLCADVGDAFEAVESSMEAHLFKYKQTKARVEALKRLQAATEQTALFQTLCASELDAVEGGTQLQSLRSRLNKLLSKVSSTRPAEQRLEKMCRRLPRVILKAEKIIADQRQLIAEQEELPGVHQWIPEVLRQLYDDVTAAALRDKQMTPMKGVIYEVMATLRELDPFFFLQVLYQPPPKNFHRKWGVVASDKLTAIAESMSPFFRDLKRRSFALRNKRDPYMRIHYGWNQLRVTMTFVRRAARHFHFLILHLYSVAMGCESPYTHAGIISEKAASGMYSADAELRSRLRLHGSAENSSDNLIKETYEWTPELLAYLDEWRRHQGNDSATFGYRRDEQIRDFMPIFYGDVKSRRHGRRIPQGDILAAIGGHLKDVEYVWRSSGLGTSNFRCMRIEDVGALEMKVKAV